MSGFGIRAAFNIGKKSLSAQSAGLNVTGNNIANVNTEGYSRQELSLNPSMPLKGPDGIFGTGVDIEGVRRIRDKLIDNQLRAELQLKGNHAALEGIYNQVQTIINEPSEVGLRALLSEFFDNFYELSNNPEDIPIRFNVREQAKLVTSAFHRIDEQLRTLSNDVEFEIKRTVERFNSLSAEVAVLNNQIVTLEGASKGTANDLRDQRDRILDEMSEVMEIFPFEKPNGAINIATQSQTIVTSNIPVEFDVRTRSENGNLMSDIVVAGEEDVFVVHDGTLGGLIEARNEIMPHFRDRLNELASELITKVNNIHLNGVGLQGTSPTIPKDIRFFTGSDAITIALDYDILEDVKNIAAAERKDILQSNGQILTTGSPGSNEIALQIADLKRKLILNDGTESLIDFFNSVVSEVGIRTKEAADNVNNVDLLIEQFSNLRDTVSGVSLDEEFVNLIKFQRGYQASARLITTVDSMFETLINM
ncbi:flagellar hook-associated protein FlgK [candidate division KSB1 bacterium]